MSLCIVKFYTTGMANENRNVAIYSFMFYQFPTALRLLLDPFHFGSSIMTLKALDLCLVFSII